MSYAVATAECTLTDIRNYRKQARDAGVQRALDLRIGRDPEELVVRQLLPFTDLGQGAVGWTIEAYRNPVIAAAGWGSVFDSGAVPAFAPTLPVGRVVVFYKWCNYTATPSMLGVRFRIGGTGASTKATFLSQLIIGSKMEPDMYFTEPVVYDPNDVVYIEGYYAAAVAALAENFAFEAFVIERVGANVS